MPLQQPVRSHRPPRTSGRIRTRRKGCGRGHRRGRGKPRTMNSSSWSVARRHQVGGDLILDAGPDLVAVDEREVGAPHAGRVHRSRPRFQSQGRDGPLGVGEHRTGRAGSCAEVGAQVARDLLSDQGLSRPRTRLSSPRAPGRTGSLLPYWYLGPSFSCRACTSGRVVLPPRAAPAFLGGLPASRPGALLDLLDEVFAVPGLLFHPPLAALLIQRAGIPSPWLPHRGG